MVVTENIFVPVRLDSDGAEWASITEASYSEVVALEDVQKNDAMRPHWTDRYPLQRIGKFKLTEVPQ